ncbi:MAG: LiaF domain-containing protein [Gemmatimonadaceae bacterium]
MADLPIPALSRAREQKISELSTHFANDDLTLEDLEKRIEQVYKAANVTELEAITADLHPAPVSPDQQGRADRGSFGASQSPAPLYQRARERVLAIMSSTRRVGRWAVPQELDVLAVMSDTKIDMTNALLPPGVIDVNVRAVMCAFKLIVPPNVQVVNEMHSFMADVRSKADGFSPSGLPARANASIIRLTGLALMAEVKVIVGHRDDAIFDDDDEDDDD